MHSIVVPETDPLADAPPGAVLADVAAGLLLQPASGITRVRVIGLPERDAVHLAVAGAASGLAVETTRDARRGLTVALTVSTTAAGEPPTPLHPRESSRLKHWLRALVRGGRK